MNFRSERGASLIEIIIGMIIFMIIFIPVTTIVADTLSKLSESNKRVNRTTEFITANNIFTDYLPAADSILQRDANRLEFRTFINGTPSYVAVWRDCRANVPHRVYYHINSPAANLLINPSFEVGTVAEYDNYASGWQRNSDLQYAPGLGLPNAPRPPGAGPSFDGRPSVSFSNANPPVSAKGNRYLKLTTPFFHLNAVDPNKRTYNRPTYGWLESRSYPASQGDVFLIGAYMRDYRADTDPNKKPRIDWHWTRVNEEGEIVEIPERSGSIVSQGTAGWSGYQVKQTSPAPEGASGIRLRLSPGLLTMSERGPTNSNPSQTEDEGADFEAVILHPISGRDNYNNLSSLGREQVYFDGSNTPNIAGSERNNPQGPHEYYSDRPGNIALTSRWGSTSHMSASYYGDLAHQTTLAALYELDDANILLQDYSNEQGYIDVCSSPALFTYDITSGIVTQVNVFLPFSRKTAPLAIAINNFSNYTGGNAL